MRYALRDALREIEIEIEHSPFKRCAKESTKQVAGHGNNMRYPNPQPKQTPKQTRTRKTYRGPVLLDPRSILALRKRNKETKNQAISNTASTCTNPHALVIHARKHTHTHTHTYTHTHTHTRLGYACAQTHTHTHTRARAHSTAHYAWLQCWLYHCNTPPQAYFTGRYSSRLLAVTVV